MINNTEIKYVGVIDNVVWKLFFFLLMCSWYPKGSGRSPAEIVSSNPDGVMDVCLLWALCVFR